MVFSDPLFLVGFLPLCLLAYHLSRRFAGGETAVAILIGASMLFYAWWSVPFLALLVAQLLVNYALARRIAQTRERRLVWAGVALNLALLGYFKYRNFLLDAVMGLFGERWGLAAVVVPLGISFHTFQQIAFLVDVRAGKAVVPRLKNYTLFILFFPQLIAGPIVLHREFEGQAESAEASRAFDWAAFGQGLVLMVYGLFKKVCLADGIAPYVDTAFSPAVHMQGAEAWVASAAFALQIFFDFSGYSDMAMGLGLMFGYRLPLNFDDPYRATSAIDLWTRWHITMTRFFVQYLYMPVAMRFTRAGVERDLGESALFWASVAPPTLITFLASGLWHGANWTFAVFGLIHGVALVCNHAWREFSGLTLPRVLGWALTMALICVADAVYRADTLAQGAQIVKAMLSPWTFALPEFMAPVAQRLGLPVGHYEFLIGYTFAARTLFWCALLGAAVFVLPNLAKAPETLRPTPRLAVALAAMIWLILTYIGEPRTFLYFQF